jgi:hypothetical protein
MYGVSSGHLTCTRKSADAKRSQQQLLSHKNDMVLMFCSQHYLQDNRSALNNTKIAIVY